MPAISTSSACGPVPPYTIMSHTSAPVPPRSGARGLYCSVCESKTARLVTLSRTVPSRSLTLVKRPPTQMLVPTCSIALTRPSTIGVLSGTSDGNARALSGSASMMAVNTDTAMAATSVLFVSHFHSFPTLSPLLATVQAPLALCSPAKCKTCKIVPHSITIEYRANLSHYFYFASPYCRREKPRTRSLVRLWVSIETLLVYRRFSLLRASRWLPVGPSSQLQGNPQAFGEEPFQVEEPPGFVGQIATSDHAILLVTLGA